MKGTFLEKIFWSIALPGFGQLLNRKFMKGFLFILLEFLVNVQSHFNQVILLSFHGKIEEAIQKTDYGWLMFYPCLYFFAMYDAIKDAGGMSKPYSFFPYVFAAYFVTVGLMYSAKVKIFGFLLGPVWLPILFVLPGVSIGFVLQFIFSHFASASKKPIE